MAWNKSLQNDAQKSVSVGAPISYAPSLQPQTGYHDGWDIVKAYKEGVSKVTWVFRCVDVIASNQATLPVILRKDNNPFGEVIADDDLLKIFNNTTNVGENALRSATGFRLSC